jgi:hypothetical protein
MECFVEILSIVSMISETMGMGELVIEFIADIGKA